ncbi:MAG: ABC transporter ATP-binding protein [Desulfobacula sp.]|jgi:biotin transport system ATP-binding protein|uniref:energy-coupling factor ABC transporter ATP-binding protein n=1 Tax=Desulfobacula sp. TaxID=2593537 RepID=UPI001D296B0F|nr:ABC transporter ATP-binding protein [Desulfobacula sp.]MBT3483832.1 ABC transporter ATP-binding protein [Desulfobacula sp.]MBT3803020.1 ABC transporter ATP-binding protein [Desulfobacula sp.]MBT4023467.1 ABC transporter ATP-binding protein [Desulfobacula sp.]MBT4197068.1 ABC transporter ATP-binding protein [Desulfobacula sp.]
MTKKIIDISSISHTFTDGYMGINNISLSIFKGEFIILAGKNGSGKTTFLKHLNGLVMPDSGVITVNGQEVKKNLIQTRKTIGMVFQDADTQIVGDTVFDEAGFGLENLKFNRTEINSKVTKVLKDLSLFHLKERAPFTLSGGEKKKLAIAGVLVMDPQVIVFDEPFSNLDYPGTAQVLTTIIDLNLSGHTIIIATHDVETVIYNATRIIIMENGQVKEDGNPADVVRHLESFGIKEPCSLKLGFGIKPWLF